MIATTLVGSALLAVALRVPRGSGWLIALSVTVATAWVAGALLSGTVPLRPQRRYAWPRLALGSAALGIGAALAFAAAFVAGRRLPVVSPALTSILGKAQAGSGLVVLVALLNAAAEEVFFRGALYDAFRTPRRGLVSTVIYVLVTAATGNIALVIAASIMGAVFAAQRAATGSIAAPLISHVAWSACMLLLLPRL